MGFVFFSAGEVSGDLSASEVIKILSDKGIKCFGIGGRNMERAGMINITNTDETLTSSVGFSESIKYILPKLRLLRFVVSYLKKNVPYVVVLVDNQGFNLQLAKECKKLGIKTFYYFPPMVSVWGEGAKYKVAKYCDKIFCTFKRDYEIYKEVSDNAFYVGHPLVDRIRNNYSSKENYLKDFKKDTKKVLLLPGSRHQEINKLLPVFLDSVNWLLRDGRGDKLEFYLVVAHPSFMDKVKNEVARRGLEGVIKVYLNNMDYALYDVADVVVASSGTTTLEMAIMGKPTVVTYIVSQLTYLVGRMLVKSRFISLPNILVGEEVFPELLQGAVNPENIANHVMKFLYDPQATDNVKDKLRELNLEGGAAIKVATEIEKTVEN
jgi:lipid-A-disaccharide synthase